MSDSGSVTEWIQQLRSADSEAASQLWGRYVDRLLRLARRMLRASPRRVADEEDVVIDVLDAGIRGIRGIQDGRFRRLHNREDLWQVLVMLTARKAIDQRRRETAERVGVNGVRGESAVENADSASCEPLAMAQVSSREPTPEEAALLVEEVEQRLEALGDQRLRNVAIAKMEGYTNREISDKLGMSLRTERKLKLIRDIWQEEP